MSQGDAKDGGAFVMEISGGKFTPAVFITAKLNCTGYSLRENNPPKSIGCPQNIVKVLLVALNGKVCAGVVAIAARGFGANRCHMMTLTLLPKITGIFLIEKLAGT